MNQTVCPVTGFALVEGLMTGYRVAKKEYGPVSPLPRDAAATPRVRATWGRFDVPGKTIYAAADTATAIIKSLAWAAQNHHHAMQVLRSLWRGRRRYVPDCLAAFADT